MPRQFQIGELRTLVARALQVSNYAPANSARVRAVPDTRTIRYYTTLGLLSPPSEMRGRVAYYDETHVLQIVAIKQLQAQNLSLSDIQQKLVGLTNRRLEAIAKLPSDFWEVADKYLVTQAERRDQIPEPQLEPVEDANEFWLTPAALPKGLSEAHDELEKVQTFSLIRLTTPHGISISIELPQGILNKQTLDTQALRTALEPFVEELRRQNLTK